ncbi:MAG: polysaccharide biosynthesis/export family protein [Pseudomonadota bacterium]
MASHNNDHRFQRGAQSGSGRLKRRGLFSGPLASFPRIASIAGGALIVAFATVAVFTPLRPPLHASDEPGTLNYPGPTAAEYKLGTQDKIRIQVFEWRPARDEIFAWDALNAEYSIGVSGQLALPLIGQIPAGGKTTGELAADISTLLQQRMGTVSAPDTTVEIIEHRPFYLTGDVTTPGEYAYRPGLTVLQAVSLGGGLRRSRDAEGAAAVRDMVQNEGNLSLLEQERIALMVRHSRLVAEIEGHKTVKTPEALVSMADKPTAAVALRNERLMFDTRKKTFKRQLQTLDELKAHLEGETESLIKQIGTADRRVALLEQELDGIRRLSRKGLVTAPRLLGLERTLAQLQGERLRLEARQSKVRSEITRTEITKLNLIQTRAEGISKDLSDTMSELDLVARRAETSSRLLGEARVRAATETASMGRTIRPKASYMLIRRISDRAIEISADENVRIMPGDTLKVELMLDETPTVEDAEPSTGLYGSSMRGPAPFQLDTSPLKPILFSEDDFAGAFYARPAVAKPNDTTKTRTPTSRTGTPVRQSLPAEATAKQPARLPVSVARTLEVTRPDLDLGAPAIDRSIPLPERRQLSEDRVLPVANPRRSALSSNNG